jgi:hypothetical protein
MPAMLNNRRSRQKKNKRLDAMNDGVPITTSFSQATSNKKNITCLKCGKKGHYANECLNTATVVAAAHSAQRRLWRMMTVTMKITSISQRKFNILHLQSMPGMGPRNKDFSTRFDPFRLGLPNKAVTARRSVLEG